MIISDRAIGNPIVESDADIAVAMSESIYQTALESVKPGGILFVNSSMVEKTIDRPEIKQIPIARFRDGSRNGERESRQYHHVGRRHKGNGYPERHVRRGGTRREHGQEEDRPSGRQYRSLEQGYRGGGKRGVGI